jgi:hypothetical protein
MTTVHLGFDMGIRNLAYCLMEHLPDNTIVTGGNRVASPQSMVSSPALQAVAAKLDDKWNVLAWDNVDLLSGGASAQTARRCVGCAGPAAWCRGEELWCKGCATGVRRKKTTTKIPTLPHLPCPVSAKDLKKLGVAGGWATAKSKKDELVAAATERYLMPWKAPKATSPSLAHIRRCMDIWLTSMLPTFSRADLIRLENQPVMKGPTMKSIQIMLFTLLGHRLEKEFAWRGEIVFVHAGVKTRGCEASGGEAADVELIEDPPEVLGMREGDEEGVGNVGSSEAEKVAEDGKAYRARKKTAETETVAALEARGASATEWLTMFQGRSKKSDLADAFLMALRK